MHLLNSEVFVFIFWKLHQYEKIEGIKKPKQNQTEVSKFA